MKQRLSIFTWHIHGTYLYYLSQGDFDIYIPVANSKREGYYGRGETFPFGENVIEIPEEQVKTCKFDCILFQTHRNYLLDQYELLSDEQRRLPAVFVEHDPPQQYPADTRHVVDDPRVTVVHVTHFNRLMWHNNTGNVRVIEHGVIPPDVHYTGEYNKGIVVINHMHQRGRKLGADIFDRISREIPLDLAGMGTKEYGGLGEVLHPGLASFTSKYRFMFNPIRYTSLGLAVCEAMMIGLPVVTLATTEYTTVIKDGINGFIHTDVDYLVEKMKLLLDNPSMAAKLGFAAKKTAQERFGIERFVDDWEKLFESVTNKKTRLYETTGSDH